MELILLFTLTLCSFTGVAFLYGLLVLTKQADKEAARTLEPLGCEARRHGQGGQL